MSSQKIGVIVAQVGTPEAPTKKALYPYLKKFLSDDRMIDAPRWVWLPILHGIILRTRPAKIAKHYADIWTRRGSPLLDMSQKQVAGIQKRLGKNFDVVLGFAYVEPSMESAMEHFEKQGISRIIVLPMFPQYSTTTTASIYDEIMLHALGRKKRGGKPVKKYSPALSFIPPFYDDKEYIKILATNLKKQIAKLKHKPSRIMISYHGIPKRYAEEGDPYPQQCDETTKQLVKAMGWKDGYYMQTYQSRFGRAEWLQPYTQVELPEWVKAGEEYPYIVSPGFTTDCLETIHELGMEAEELIEGAGGNPASLQRAHCLNDDPVWLDYLAQKIKNIAG
ncbi:ferrochelatase [Candidatus Saccharibacteria bacterium]|nr:ferrochelatase [Candidatus Saccharibacteria bacterium]